MPANKIQNTKNAKNEWAVYCTVQGTRLYTQSGMVWRNMRNRCTPGTASQLRNPHYIGCTMSQGFKDFQFFAEWHMKQVGFGVEDYQIDKDILVPGNRIYSEDTCVLVPRALNNFLITSPSRRGAYPQGVCFYEQTNKYHSQINIDGKLKHLGYYNTVSEASEAYQEAKLEEAKRWHLRLLNGEFIVDVRVINAVEGWVKNAGKN